MLYFFQFFLQFLGKATVFLLPVIGSHEFLYKIQK